MVRIDAIYDGSLRCEATHEPSGTRVATDAPKDNQGLGASFSPTDLVATALGTCAMTTMAIVARQDGVELDGMQLHVVKHMAAEPRRIGALPIEIVMPKRLEGAPKEKVEYAALYCPVARSLSPELEQSITFVYPD
jgi:putative redox protein